MRLVEKEVYYHIDTRDVAKFYMIALHFSIDLAGKHYAISCRKLSNKQIDYLEKHVGIKLGVMDNVVLYLKGV